MKRRNGGLLLNQKRLYCI